MHFNYTVRELDLLVSRVHQQGSSTTAPSDSYSLLPPLLLHSVLLISPTTVNIDDSSNSPCCCCSWGTCWKRRRLPKGQMPFKLHDTASEVAFPSGLK